MPTDISSQLVDELMRPRVPEEATPSVGFDLQERITEIELRQRELHALVLEVRERLDTLIRGERA